MIAHLKNSIMPHPTRVMIPLRAGQWRHLHIEPELGLVTLPKGASLDFGGIAKGLAVDAAVGLLESEAISCALVDAGGDLSVLGRPPEASGWVVAVETGDSIHDVELQAGAIATSSISVRHWMRNGEERHQIIDPRTGRPAQNELQSVTVAAARCVEADVAAKVAFILGPERGPDFIEDHGLAALFVSRNGTVRPTGHWPAIEPVAA